MTHVLCVSLGHWASTRFCDALPLDTVALGHVALHSIAPNISRDIDPEILGGRAAFMWLFMGQGIPARPPTVMCQHALLFMWQGIPAGPPTLMCQDAFANVESIT